MTVQEKVNLTTAVTGPCQANSGGVPRLGIPGLCFNDGPAGPRYTDYVTQWPSEFISAASFDRDLMWERAVRIGQEFRGKGVNVMLGPPLHRTKLGRRVLLLLIYLKGYLTDLAAFSPDTYLSSTLSYLTTRALQSTGLITSAKHYILYEQEPACDGPPDPNGGTTGCVDISSDIDEKTFREVYLPSFSEAVRAGTGSIMCSYNQINGTPACENDSALNRVLKEELNFEGFDFEAAHSTVESAIHGMDMELPTEHFYGKKLLKAVERGEVSSERLDDMARRILIPYLALQHNSSYPKVTYQKYNLQDQIEVDGHVFRNEHVDVKGDNHLWARKVAAESTVLLKNTGILPLPQGPKPSLKSLGIFGSDADYPSTLTGCGPDLFCTVNAKNGRRYWNGTVTIGGGSGAAYADYIVTPIEAISLRARRSHFRTDHILQDDPSHFLTVDTIAAQSDVCLVFVSVYLVEAWDRDDLRLDKGGEELIKRVEKGCKGEVVVVMHSGGQVLVEDWIDLPKIGAVLFAGYPGQETGNALVDILWGDVNPSAKLPFTMGRAASDWPPAGIIRKKAAPYPVSTFPERSAIDYKYFDTHNISPRFEFGFGLSYTSFEMAGLELRKEFREEEVGGRGKKMSEVSEGEGGLYEILYVARVNVTNTGRVPGAEVAQLASNPFQFCYHVLHAHGRQYMTFPPTEADQPPKHLRGYSKPYLLPGQTKTVEFPLKKKDLSVWDVEKHLWRMPEGNFVFRAGNSSRALPLVSLFTPNGRG
ncbi:hypothetical protein L198_06145 [Cryptococcus wingfieldii CBS 7118]|uniref:Probable beta-glucosidase G n=1 Tax=Cryptococcus wingfieldii CBS 7118 TaxID=1295528 RepID=A0A1E3IQL7_9TREE|nr:hypothetical protein L198_06145 [Cryptococcus wingfieldii CBS 7118]ODN90828.1 hypothetical protein L198_06145 [Cryptococcus wingfieldii CBS 7118]